MSADLIETLPLPQRLALSYAPRVSRPATLALLALDARFAGIVRGDGESIIAQMKLAWWRERLAQDPQDWPLGEPLLALLRDAGVQVASLTAMVDGWEGLLAEQLDTGVLESFAGGRAALWQRLASGDVAGGDVDAAARGWALVDLSLNLGTEEEAEAVRAIARQHDWSHKRLPRRLRPLAVLHGLSRRALDREAEELLDGPGAMFTALRLGMTGQ